jgi:cyanophycinase
MFLEREIERPHVGKLIMIGGHENKNKGTILHAIAKSLPENGRLGVAPLATKRRSEYWRDYRTAFPTVGLNRGRTIPLMEKYLLLKYLSESHNPAIFIPGGDQERLVEELEEDGLHALQDLYKQGGTVAGTSAGSCMGKYMIVGRDGGRFDIQRGLDFTQKIITDNHFSERNRQERLIAAVMLVAEWERNGVAPVGMGIDEDTAVVLTDDRYAEVIGTGNVTIIEPSMHLHILNGGDRFDLDERRVT